MLKFELNIADRKTLANRMEELTGIHPYYTRAPLYAYDRDGNLLVEPENADAELLTTLLNEGLIRGGESIESTDDQPENTEPTENLTAEPVTEEEPDDTAEDGATEDEPDAEESESEEQPEAEDQPEEVPLDLELAFPTSQHNGVSLRNLVNRAGTSMWKPTWSKHCGMTVAPTRWQTSSRRLKVTKHSAELRWKVW